ncbi:YhdB family protein [Gracilibacillus caseinilyticus]|uniref:YhdB family protein n=1 Tax=Gracilibacillus caseinilyticus TaxID=2932256 RepID=A0ABY4EQL4_9BACI|nr:YhdB family protein [Gracilibacillus caseinilyticus]UOQ46746.1 YhdB family protein [Gracilibacillus caseinilyticus]
MTSIDYDKALYYMLWGQWDDLLVLMVRTNDDLLSKKIEQFLHAYHYPRSRDYLMNTHEELMHYIDHALVSQMLLEQTK